MGYQAGGSQVSTGQYYQPYYDSIAQKSSALGSMPFTPYGGEIAPNANQFSTQAAQGLSDFQTPWQFGWGSDRLAEATDLMRGQTGYESGGISSNYTPNNVSMFAKPGDVQMYSKPGDMQMYGKPNDVQMFAKPGDVSMDFAPGEYSAEAVSKYSNPYMQNVVEIQKREAERAYAMQQQQRQASAVQQGAFGGSRAGLVDQAARRDQNMLLDDIQQKGSAQAYTEGSALFEKDRQARALAAQLGLTADQFNASLGMQHGIAGLGAQEFNSTMAQKYGADWLGMQQGNINKDLTFGGQGLDVGKYNAGMALDYGKTGVLNDQFNETSRFKSGQLDLQSQIENEAARARAAGVRQSAITGIGQLGTAGANIGTAQGNQQLSRLGGLGALGNSMWDQQFKGDQANYQDYLTQQMFPMEQLAWQKGIMSGLPGPTLQSTQYGVPGGNSTAAGLGNVLAIAGMLGN